MFKLVGKFFISSWSPLIMFSLAAALITTTSFSLFNWWWLSSTTTGVGIPSWRAASTWERRLKAKTRLNRRIKLFGESIVVLVFWGRKAVESLCCPSLGFIQGQKKLRALVRLVSWWVCSPHNFCSLISKVFGPGYSHFDLSWGYKCLPTAPLKAEINAPYGVAP